MTDPSLRDFNLLTTATPCLCEGPALTGEEETEEDKGKEPEGKEPEAEGSEKQEGSAREHPVIEELLHYA